MNVGEEAEYPWLEREYDLLRGWVADQTPLLGICLGGQTLAHALGGAVELLPTRLAGFRELELTEAGSADPLLGVLPPRFPAFFGNAYGLTVPPDGVALALDGKRAQAFRVGDHAWGFQFHPEVRREQILAWLRLDRDLPRPVETVIAETDAGIGDWNRLGRALCAAFLAAGGG
jgi:GMP synthase-like glutamine amidotransferase